MGLMVILAIIFSLTAIKQICDLKEQNIRLMKQLAFERQKDAALKLAVRDNIPAVKFIQQRFNSVETDLVEAEGKVDQPNTGWSINLSVLWTSPIITPCDMARLSHILAEEIYAHQEEMLEQTNSLNDINEVDMEEEIGNEEIAIANFLKSANIFEPNEYENKESSEENDLSEENDSSEENDFSEELTLNEFSLLNIN